MIQTLPKREAIARMNEWGQGRQPFLLLADFEMEKLVVIRLEDINPSELLYDINGNTNAIKPARPFPQASLGKFPMPRSAYHRAFKLVQENIQAGNSYLLNLAFPTPVSTPLHFRQIFYSSLAPYRICWDGRFVCFSPEAFIKIGKEGKISSFPMKGTIDAQVPGAHQRLLDNEKEKAEHATIVDLIRNDLSMVAEKVRVNRYRYIEEIETHQGGLLQSSTEISGQLEGNFLERLGHIVFKLLPAGSISGAPKQKTAEIIRAAEGQARGYYTGICGLFDGSRFDSGVMIRFIEKGPNGLLFKSGSGITANSLEEDEYEEMIRKAYLPFAKQPELASL